MRPKRTQQAKVRTDTLQLQHSRDFVRKIHGINILQQHTLCNQLIPNVLCLKSEIKKMRDPEPIVAVHEFATRPMGHISRRNCDPYVEYRRAEVTGYASGAV